MKATKENCERLYQFIRWWGHHTVNERIREKAFRILAHAYGAEGLVNDCRVFREWQTVERHDPRWEIEIRLSSTRNGFWLFAIDMTFSNESIGYAPSLHDRPFHSREAALLAAVEQIRFGIEAKEKSDRAMERTDRQLLFKKARAWLDTLATCHGVQGTLF